MERAALHKGRADCNMQNLDPEHLDDPQDASRSRGARIEIL